MVRIHQGASVTARLLSHISPATLRSMSRIREEMERMPENSDMGDPVALQLLDVAALMRQILSRLR